MGLGHRACALAAACLLAVSQAAAQQNSRRIFVSVQSINGAPITDLGAADFHLLENGVERPVTRAALATEPMRVVLVIDASTSIAGMLNDFRGALHAFVDALPAPHEIAFLSVGGQLRVRVPPTDDRAKLHSAISLFSSDGGAMVLVESLLEADKRFLRPAPEKWPVFVIVTTDGASRRSEPPVDEFNAMVSDLVARGGVAHAIVIRTTTGGGLTTEVARNIAGRTGGIYEQVAIANSLDDYLTKFAARLVADHASRANNYEVEYASSVAARLPPPPVEISVNRQGTRLRLSLNRPF